MASAPSIVPVQPASFNNREHDVYAAHAHGLLAIGALWGYGSEEELLEAGADRLAPAPGDVLDLTTEWEWVGVPGNR